MSEKMNLQGGPIALAQHAAERYLGMKLGLPDSLGPKERNTVMLLGLIRACVIAGRSLGFKAEDLVAAILKESELFETALARLSESQKKEIQQ
jgi:hypothetical protein